MIYPLVSWCFMKHGNDKSGINGIELNGGLFPLRNSWWNFKALAQHQWSSPPSRGRRSLAQAAPCFNVQPGAASRSVRCNATRSVRCLAESRSNRSSFWPMDPDRTDPVPFGYLTVCHGKSPFLMGKSTINGPFSMAMLNNQRVDLQSFWPTAVPTSTAAVSGTVISTEDQTPSLAQCQGVTNGTWNLEWEPTSSWEGKPDKMSFRYDRIYI